MGEQNAGIGIIGLILQLFGLLKKDNSSGKERIGICPNAEFEDEIWMQRGACRCRVYEKLLTDPKHVWRYCQKYYLQCKGNNGIVIPKFNK